MREQHPNYGVNISLQELIALRKQLSPAPILKRKLHHLSGLKLANIRGRGIEFDSTREYQPGDDIRSMAWRVTARSLKPHIKVYREERDRPIWLALDLSPSLYFGTRCVFKSVQSIIQASLIGWSSLQKSERIGAILTSLQKPRILPAQIGEKHFLNLLQVFAKASQAEPNFNEENQLQALLQTLQQNTRAGHTIYLYSDFFNFDKTIQQLLIALNQRTQLRLNFIYDPFEANPPPPNEYFITDGQDKLLFNMLDEKNRKAYQQLFQAKLQQLKKFAVHHNIPLQGYCTDAISEVSL